MATKAASLDRMTPRMTGLVAVVFVGLLFVIALAGVNSPNAAIFREFPFTAPCSPTACNASAEVQLTDLDPWNQATWLTMRMERPLIQTAGGQRELLLKDQPLTFELRWSGSIFLDGSTGSTGGANVSHITRVSCEPGQPSCSSVLILAQPWIQSRTYRIQAVFRDVLAPFAGQLNLVPEVRGVFRQGYIEKSYTSFELGWRAAFNVFTVFFYLYYCIRLCSGPGNKDESTGAMLKPSPQQVFVAFLGALLFWFNDPFYIAYITLPSVGVAGAQAFFTATFLCLLLFWFLVAFDLARLQGENGPGWDPATAEPATRPGTCFWLPKSLLIAVLWTISLAGYVYVRYSQLSDPAFSVTEAAGAFWPFVQAFIAGLGGIYVLYGFGILVLAFRNFPRMTQSNKFVVAVTVTSLLIIMVGFFTSAFLGVRVASALRIVTYGCANLYVWFLFFIYIPAPRPDGWSSVPTGPGGAQAPEVPSARAGATWTGSSEAQEAGASKTGSGDGDSADIDLEMPPEELEVRVGGAGHGVGAGEAGRAERVRRMSGKEEFRPQPAVGQDGVC